MNTSALVISGQRFHLTYHATTRLAQRNLTTTDVAYVLRNGQRLHRDGVVFYFLGKRDLPTGASFEARRLEGTTVVVDPQSLTIITVYRNRKALRRIKRKHKRTGRKGGFVQPRLVH